MYRNQQRAAGSGDNLLNLGRAELEKLPLAFWASRRRQELNEVVLTVLSSETKPLLRDRNNCLILLKRRRTGRTLQLLTEMFKSPLRRRNPRVDGPRRIVTDVLLVAAFKFSYPVAVKSTIFRGTPIDLARTGFIEPLASCQAETWKRCPNLTVPFVRQNKQIQVLKGRRVRRPSP
jgi:hypothetical protein